MHPRTTGRGRSAPKSKSGGSQEAWLAAPGRCTAGAQSPRAEATSACTGARFCVTHSCWEACRVRRAHACAASRASRAGVSLADARSHRVRHRHQLRRLRQREFRAHPTRERRQGGGQVRPHRSLRRIPHARSGANYGTGHGTSANERQRHAPEQQLPQRGECGICAARALHFRAAAQSRRRSPHPRHDCVAPLRAASRALQVTAAYSGSAGAGSVRACAMHRRPARPRTRAAHAQTEKVQPGLK